MRLIPCLLVLLMCSGCLYVPVEDYVHEETQELRGNRNWPSKDMGIEGRELVLVPNFRSFTSEYSERRASLMILSRMPRDIHFARAEIINKDSGFVLSLTLDQTVRVDRPYYQTGYYINYSAISLLSGVNTRDFVDASSIEVRLWYAPEGLPEVAGEEFVINRVFDWQWESPPV
jgi:hypothetical protein